MQARFCLANDPLDVLEGYNNVHGSAASEARAVGKGQMEGNARRRDRSDRATRDLVLDPRTCLVGAFLLLASLSTHQDMCD